MCATDADNNVLVSDKKQGLLVLNHSGHWTTFANTVKDLNHVIVDNKHTMFALACTADGWGSNVVFTNHLDVYELHKIDL